MAEGIKKVSENVIMERRALTVTDPTVPDNKAISVGALWSDPDNKGLKLKTGTDTFSLFDAAQLIIPGSIITELLKDECVTTIKINGKAVTEPKINDQAVSTRTIENSAVTEIKIADKAVTSNKIKELNVLTRHYDDLSVTTPKIDNRAITDEKIDNHAVNNHHINNNAVNARTINSKALEERHYSDISIPFRAYQKSSIYGDVIKNRGVNVNHLDDASVVTRTLAEGAVTSGKIADNNIKNIHLTTDCVSTDNIASKAVTTAKIENSAIVTDKIQDKSVTKAKLADDVIGLIGDPVLYDSSDDVSLRKDLSVPGSVNVTGTLTARKVYNAVFMDLAEAYKPAPNIIFKPGDIVQVNNDGLLVKALPTSRFPIVGVVSEEYAACYGAAKEELEAGFKIPVGLIGKVPVNVIGPVKLGDKIALMKDGMGASCSTYSLSKDNIIGKALQTNDSKDPKTVLCLIFPH